ncbi:proteasome maturation protein-like [Cynocephalus volans]|uniref:proteasome maturation protein-like n=1 Tax=Cynocephalus volans TaxID=110931 RepID=UPI002FC9EBCD
MALTNYKYLLPILQNHLTLCIHRKDASQGLGRGSTGEGSGNLTVSQKVSLCLEQKSFTFGARDLILSQEGDSAVRRAGLKIRARELGSQLKHSIPVTELSATGPLENHDLLQRGFSCVKDELLPSHPLELPEKNFQLNQDKMNFSTLRNIQGLFAPLKLQMEFKAVQQVQRLPFLSSTSLSLDILRSNNETTGFEDILNNPSQSELMGESHLMVEYKLGLL